MGSEGKLLLLGGALLAVGITVVVLFETDSPIGLVDGDVDGACRTADEAARELDEMGKELHLELPPIRRPRD